MVAHKWTTPEQETFLRDNIASFLEHKAAKTKPLFWSRIEREWFEQWPIETSTFKHRRKQNVEQGTPEEIHAKKINSQRQVRHFDNMVCLNLTVVHIALQGLVWVPFEGQASCNRPPGNARPKWQETAPIADPSRIFAQVFRHEDCTIRQGRICCVQERLTKRCQT